LNISSTHANETNEQFHNSNVLARNTEAHTHTVHDQTCIPLEL